MVPVMVMVVVSMAVTRVQTMTVHDCVSSARTAVIVWNIGGGKAITAAPLTTS